MSDQSFWNSFYANRQGDKRFDWFVNFDDVAGYLDPYLPNVSYDDAMRILDIGCGTSDFSLKLFENMNRKCRIDCVDFSSEAIKAMEKIIRERRLKAVETFDPEGNGTLSRDCTGLTCHQADVRNLPFKEGTFSLAFDKGTSDAVLKGPDGESAFVDVVKESWRVLKPGGKLIQFSDEPPEIRLSLLEKVRRELLQPNRPGNHGHLSFIWRELEGGSGFQYFMYVVHKGNSR